MAIDILQVLRFGAVDVAWKVEVEVVFRVGNLCKGDHAGIVRSVSLPGKGIDDAVDVLLAQAVLVAILDKSLAGINHENTPASSGILLVEHQNTGRDAGAIEEVGWQADDPLENTGTDKLLTNDSLGIAPEEHTMRQDTGTFTGTLHATDNVQQVGIVALFGGRLTPGKALVWIV